MILINVSQFLGEIDDLRNARTTFISFATKLPLSKALKELLKYRITYKRKYPSMSLSFNLLNVSEIEDVDGSILEQLNVAMIENLNS